MIGNNMNIQQKNTKGYVILFAVLLVSIILSITISIANIAMKEVNFTVNARESGLSFFAADSGGECALYSLKKNVFDDPSTIGQPLTMDCGTAQITASPTGTDPIVYTFTGLPTNNNKGCAIVTVSLGTTLRTISSYGYNVSCNQVNNTNNARRVERLLTYTIPVAQ